MSNRIGAWNQRPWGQPWGDRATRETVKAISEIGLARGMCYGPCPVYRLSLARSGQALFTGEHSGGVTVLGTRPATSIAMLAERH